MTNMHIIDGKNGVLLPGPPNNRSQTPTSIIQANEEYENEYKPKVFSAEYTHFNEYHPARTVLVLNFQEEAGMFVQSLMADFGIMEVFEIIADRAFKTCIAVIQYAEVVSALNALLALPEFKVRSSMNLDVRILWDGCSERKCNDPIPNAARRTIFVANSLFNQELIRLRCCQYGYVQQINPVTSTNNQYRVLFHSSLAAVVATYCLRNADLLLGYDSAGGEVLGGPTCEKPLHDYRLPLNAFEVTCILKRFEDYCQLAWVSVNMRRTLSAFSHLLFPGKLYHCANLFIPPSKDDVTVLAVHLHVLLFESEKSHSSLVLGKYVVQLTLDFELNRPIAKRNKKQPSAPGSWQAFFIVELQVFWDNVSDNLVVHAGIQGMNHVYSQVAPAMLNKNLTSVWFGRPLRQEITVFDDPMGCMMSSSVLGSYLRIAAYVDEFNSYRIPVHITWDPEDIRYG